MDILFDSFLKTLALGSVASLGISVEQFDWVKIYEGRDISWPYSMLNNILK